MCLAVLCPKGVDEERNHGAPPVGLRVADLCFHICKAILLLSTCPQTLVVRSNALCVCSCGAGCLQGLISYRGLWLMLRENRTDLTSRGIPVDRERDVWQAVGHMVWSSGQRGRKGSEWIGMQNPKARAKTIFYLPHCKIEWFAKDLGLEPDSGRHCYLSIEI